MITLLRQQKTVFTQVKDFLSNESMIFLLKGYAGTGKTTMIKAIVEYLEGQHKSYQLMAPTGRAAKVMRDKLNVDAQTIHRSIYSSQLVVKEASSDDVSTKSFKYVFPIKKCDVAYDVVIVDESSMVSDAESINEFFQFGSGRLLTDLLDYVSQSDIKKMIFVGDSAQLPPVGDSKSLALDESFLLGKGFSVESAELTEVFRQDKESGILDVATDLRSLIQLPKAERNSLSIAPNDRDILEVLPSEIATKYTDIYPNPEVGNGVVVCFSNRNCFYVNQVIRSVIFKQSDTIQVGDVVLINNNNYYTFKREIFNGDMAKVISVGETEIHRNIPVTIKGKKTHVDLSFLNLGLLFPDGQIIECNVIENLLYCEERDISVEEQRALYIDFCMRYKGLKEGSDLFKNALKEDKYFNALRIKFGYAITCHKAQGGEWDKVFVDFSGRHGLYDDALRWCYTAITRAKETLFICNAPNINAFSNIKVTAIGCVNKSPDNYFSNLFSVETPFHSKVVPIGVKLKCLGVIEHLKDSKFNLEKVDSLDYQERYFIIDNESTKGITIIAYYDKNGVFKRLPIKNDNSDEDVLRETINKVCFIPDNCIYSPSNNLMKELFERISSLCSDLGIVITNIIEFLDNYYVMYCVKTDAMFAYIQFYFKEGKITTIMPKSELGEDDCKLKELISNFY